MQQQIVYRLAKVLFSKEGRMSRSRYWSIMLPLWAVFWCTQMLLSADAQSIAANALLLVFLAPVFFVSAKRLHDTDKSAWWLSMVLIPVLGPIWLFIELGLRGGTESDNRFGDNPLNVHYDYLTLP